MIGERVRKYRRQKGWSQEQLGDLIGFSQSKISKIEHGDWDSLSDLRLIAKALEIPIEELITDHYAVNKKRTRLFPHYGKFRRHTIDLKNELFNTIANATK